MHGSDLLLFLQILNMLHSLRVGDVMGNRERSIFFYSFASSNILYLTFEICKKRKSYLYKLNNPEKFKDFFPKGLIWSLREPMKNINIFYCFFHF